MHPFIKITSFSWLTLPHILNLRLRSDCRRYHISFFTLTFKTDCLLYHLKVSRLDFFFVAVVCPGITKLSARVGVEVTYRWQLLRTPMTPLSNDDPSCRPPPHEQSRCQVAEQTFHFSGAVQAASSSVAVCHVASDRKRERPDWDASVEKCDTTRV